MTLNKVYNNHKLLQLPHSCYQIIIQLFWIPDTFVIQYKDKKKIFDLNIDIFMTESRSVTVNP